MSALRWLVVAIGAAIALRELAWATFFQAGHRLIDFRVFWCGGRVALDGASPYVTGPLLACEHLHGTPYLLQSPNLVLPFVLPPFDLIPLWAFAALPFDAGARVYVVVAVLALAAAIVLIARSTDVAAVTCAAALAMSAGLPSLALGQLLPFELVALAAAATALNARRDAIAGVCAALTLFEPHIGGFVVVTLLIAAPRARAALAWSIGAIVLAGIAVAGPAASLAYAGELSRVAIAEAGFYEQYSFTYLLSAAGLPHGIALTLAALSSLVMLAAAVVLARAVATACPRAALAYVPAACSAIAGTYIHVTQVAIAVPAALLLVRHAPSAAARRWAAAAIVLLAVPWPYPVLVKQALACTMLVLAVLAWQATRSWAASAAVAFACWLVFSLIENHPPPASPIPILARSPDSASPSVSLERALGQLAAPDARYLIIKLPTWFGLIATLAAAGSLLRKARPAPIS